MKKSLLLTIAGILAVLFGFAHVRLTTAQANAIFYVKPAATGSGDGLS